MTEKHKEFVCTICGKIVKENEEYASYGRGMKHGTIDVRCHKTCDPMWRDYY